MDKSISVLVVEDILAARETVIHLLRALGFSSFFEAEHGLDALEILKEHPIDLVISDWNMPRMNGLRLLRKVRADESLKHIPFIFLTSRTEADDVALASDVGVSGYLIKPVTIKALDNALARILSDTFEQDFEMVKSEVQTYLGTNDYEAAENLLFQFEKTHPTQSGIIRFELAKILMHKKDFEQAESFLQKFLEVNPLFARGWELLARAQTWAGKWDDALFSANKSIEISPNNTDYYLLRGHINLHKNDLHQARTNFMTALNIDRKNDQIKQDIWNAYVDMDLVDEVQNEFGTYIFSYLNCDTLNNMAVAYRRQGELGRAIDIYRVALIKEPDNPKILYNAAVAYMNRKQYGKARELLFQALNNDPDFEEAILVLRKIDEMTKPTQQMGGMA